ncbi:2-octaprenyl-3-methyl-6-methoxy-1,4-benzoquinol hydroxylase [Alteromonas sp. KUL42]|uniref:FAD-dependent monooxygenase n=1 Tax=Alteromonas sp. KUL42 TaxID=2480797 RepID=UPI0010368265|nr:FAD-dependent monooxygenase [Alteromonas sp. KUL42]TAP31473.1 2-octaprenyl-3-methyl-6-methoxy-1,4-benzoquinol hydroxylase [Alteromonas sp. KUL42]GEA09399.1 2-octaprenyl-3-methyl-6-methoxy-1,4-benzoquinol hydroxylase [Alteromonas sp. KUL42]
MYDFCINGGGMVGAALALGLGKQNYNVAVIEPNLPKEFNAADGPDLRVSAISEASVTLLKALGAWPFIEAMRVKAYRGLSVWESPNSRTDFTADSISMTHLGYFVENRLLQLGCHQALAKYSNVDVISGHSVLNILLHSHATLTLSNNQKLEAQWLIGADGANSQVRSVAGIGSTGWQYAQQAMGITIKLENPVQPITWQQFTPKGPMAFLPMFDNYASLVWYNSVDELKRLKSLNSVQLKNAIISAFPKELTENNNDFEIVDKAVFPLTRSHANQYIKGRCVLLGDAAHTINPLAGQGVNLGFKDVEAFLSVTSEHLSLASDEFSVSLTRHFEKPRRRDNLLMMTAMDGFYTLFSNDITPIHWIRNQLLSVAQRIEPAKKEVLKYAIGLR